jgi:hypothetical protein
MSYNTGGAGREVSKTGAIHGLFDVIGWSRPCCGRPDRTNRCPGQKGFRGGPLKAIQPDAGLDPAPSGDERVVETCRAARRSFGLLQISTVDFGR